MRLRQPRDGARTAIDPIFLAAAVPAGPGQVVLDIGCGSGAASLCLAARVPECRVVGLELQTDLTLLADDNIAINGMTGRVCVLAGDLLRPPPGLVPGSFDHVMANPPFLERGRASPPPNPAKAAAAIEGEAGLGDWVRFAVTMARPKGSITFVHRADRIDALLGYLAGGAGRAGGIVVFPLWPAAGRDAGRVLVRARKQTAAPARLAAGLVLHEADGRFTAAAEAILRGGAVLAL
ncbi:MAG: tRNA1(Val) (adenine(37)-N6)-methyltransferase [Alphaproteobacteria bacterium]